ncbi:hypothetical protein Tco_0948618 [Tanacetum coccineum]
MAGIINKIGDALHISGNKDEDKNKKHETEYAADRKKHEGGEKSSEHKEEKNKGIVDKIKDKISGDKKDGECSYPMFY